MAGQGVVGRGLDHALDWVQQQALRTAFRRDEIRAIPDQILIRNDRFFFSPQLARMANGLATRVNEGQLSQDSSADLDNPFQPTRRDHGRALARPGRRSLGRIA